MRYLFLVYLLINPSFFVAGAELRPAQEWCYQFSSMILVIAGLFFNQKPLKPSKFNLWLGIFLLWFIAVYLIYTTGWSVLLNVFLGAMVYLTAIKTLEKKDLSFLVKGISWVVISAIIVWAMQFLGFDLFGQRLRNPANLPPDCSFFGIKAALGMYLALAMPLILTFSWIGLALFIPLALTYSTGAYLGAIIAVLFFLWFVRRKFFWFLLPFIIIGGIFFVIKMDAPTGMFGSRIPMWKIVIQDSFKKPLFGYGLDSFRDPQKDGYARYYKYSFDNHTVKLYKRGSEWGLNEALSPDAIGMIKKNINPLDYWDNVHSLYIQIFYELGLGGLVLLFLLIRQGWHRFKFSRKETETVALMAVIIAFGVFCLTQFPFHISRIGHIFPIILGMFYIWTEDNG